MTDSSPRRGSPFSLRLQWSWFALPGLLHAAAAFTPAMRVRLLGVIPFFQAHWAGALLLALGFVSVIAAMMRRPVWMLIASATSLLIVAGMYVRLVHAPLRNFADHLVRHLEHPAWGFVPMSVCVLLEIIAATWMMATMGRSATPLDSTVDARRDLLAE